MSHMFFYLTSLKVMFYTHLQIIRYFLRMPLLCLWGKGGLGMGEGWFRNGGVMGNIGGHLIDLFCREELKIETE